MKHNIKISSVARDFIFRIATPVSVATPEIIEGKAKGKKIKVQVELPEKLNAYLEDLAAKFQCNKAETLTSIIETFAQNGIKIDELLEVTFYAKQLSKENAIKLKQSVICAALLMYLSKLKLNAAEWQILIDNANLLRGIKRKYTRL
jgi:hypothetical protein